MGPEIEFAIINNPPSNDANNDNFYNNSINNSSSYNYLSSYF